jgi:hypothetical protein
MLVLVGCETVAERKLESEAAEEHDSESEAATQRRIGTGKQTTEEQTGIGSHGAEQINVREP